MKVGRSYPAFLPALLASVAITATSAHAVAAPPELSFEDQAVVVSGAPPGGSVAVFGVSHGFNGFTTYFLRTDELLVDEDGDGTVRLELELPLSKVRSVWAAVDLTSGDLTLGAPGGVQPAVGEIPADGVSAEGGEVTAPVQRWAYALWVRPGPEAGAGAWGAIVRDGGGRDGDGLENREVRMSVSSFVPIERESEGRPPELLAAGDLVLVVDPETLAVSSARLTGK